MTPTPPGATVTPADATGVCADTLAETAAGPALARVAAPLPQPFTTNERFRSAVELFPA